EATLLAVVGQRHGRRQRTLAPTPRQRLSRRRKHSVSDRCNGPDTPPPILPTTRCERRWSRNATASARKAAQLAGVSNHPVDEALVERRSGFESFHRRAILQFRYRPHPWPGAG